MELTHVDVNSIFTVGGFVAAIVWQSAMLKTKVTEVHTRISEIEDDLKQVSSLLIANEAQKVKLENMERRLSNIENRCFSAPPEH